jgi:hypothetical protein
MAARSPGPSVRSMPKVGSRAARGAPWRSQVLIAPAHDDAGLQLALTLADADARWGDHEAALRALDSAEALARSGRPSDYQVKRTMGRREVEAEARGEHRQAG